MRNKGLKHLHTPNTILASPETAPTATTNFIESIVAHRYFHNWTEQPASPAKRLGSKLWPQGGG